MPVTELPLFIAAFVIVFIASLTFVAIRRAIARNERKRIKRMQRELSRPDPRLTAINEASSLEDLERLDEGD